MIAATRTDAAPIRHEDGRAHLAGEPLSCGQPIDLLRADGTWLEGRYEIAWSPTKHDVFFTAAPIASRYEVDPEDGPALAQLSCPIHDGMLFRRGSR